MVKVQSVKLMVLCSLFIFGAAEAGIGTSCPVKGSDGKVNAVKVAVVAVTALVVVAGVKSYVNRLSGKRAEKIDLANRAEGTQARR